MGFYLGKNDNATNNIIPQAIILNSGPGLTKIQLVTDEFLNALNNGGSQAYTKTFSLEALFIILALSKIKGREAIRKRFEEEVLKEHGRNEDYREGSRSYSFGRLGNYARFRKHSNPENRFNSGK